MAELSLHVPRFRDTVPAAWGWSRLDGICTGVFDCPHSTPILADSGPYIVRSQDIRTGLFLAEQAARVSEDTHKERIARAEPRYGDLFFSREGTYFGIAAEVPQGIRACLGQRMVLLRPDAGHVHFRYLRYWLNSPVMVAYIRGFRDGSVAERLNMPTIRALPVLVPPLPEQRAIAHILGTLDDKIELNRRMSETLEAMARATFKSWFVDFEPVRAKAQGRDPGLPKPIADVFPDRFQDSELGEIPKGWKVETLGNVIELAYGKALKQEDRKAGSVAVFGSNGQVGWHDEKLVTGPGIVVGRKGNPGVVKWVQTDFFPIDTTFYVVQKNKCRSLHFLFYALKVQDLASLGADSAVPGLNRNLAYMSKQIVPSGALLDTFESFGQPLFQRIYEADNESGTIASMRDALLPKLISGELKPETPDNLTENLK